MGDVVAACPGLTPSTFYRRLETEAPIREALTQAREKVLYDVESVFLDMCLRERNVQCIIHFLKTKGRQRGYGEQLQVTLTEADRDVKSLSVEELEALIAIPSVL